MALPPSVILGFKCVPALIEAAKERRTLTYTEIGDAIGHPAFYMGAPLKFVRDKICAEHGLPPLTVLVVDQISGLPGDNFFQGGHESLTPEAYRAIVEDLTLKVYEFKRWDEIWTNLQREYGLVNIDSCRI